MPSVSLEKLLGRKSEIGKILVELSGNTGQPFSIEDTNGKVVFGVNTAQPVQGAAQPVQGAAHPAQRFPIEQDDQVLGWVTGDASASVLAALLNYAVRQEDEKKSLANELVDRYRELSLLYHLSERMAASPQPEAVAEIALEEARRLIKADSGAILFLDGGDLRTASSFGVSHPFIQQGCLPEQILKTGKAELANDISGEDCKGVDEGQRISILGAPLKTERRILGIIFLVGSQNQAFTAGELKLLNAIAMQVAPALEISRLYQELIEKARYEHELKMARQVQESLLPLHLPEIPGWSIASRWRPAREVSGDFYDVIVENDQAVDLVIADVTDKGLPAALFMVFTRSILRASIYNGDAPANLITSVNQSICRDSYEGLFTTLVYTRLDTKTGQLTYVNAGHNPPLLYHARSDMVETLGRTGLTLGVDIDSLYLQTTAQMEVGDVLLFYTDGITEAINPDQQEFGIERLKQQVLRYRGCEIEVILNELEAALLEFTNHSQPLDDMTLLGLKRIETPGG